MVATISDMEEARAFLAQRKAAEGLSTAEMAARLGINRVYLHLILKGDRPVSVKLARRLRHIYPELLLILVRELTSTEAPVAVAS